MKILGPEARGSWGNVTVSRNRSGLYQRARNGRGGVPSHSLAGAVAAWQALSSDEQLAWGTWSQQIRGRNSLGQEKILSGFDRYVSSWMLAFLFGATLSGVPARRSRAQLSPPYVSVVAPLTVQIGAFGDVPLTEGPAAVQLYLNYPAASTGTNCPPGRSSHWRFMGGALVGPGPVAAATNFTFLASGRVFGKARIIGDDWVPGPWLRTPDFVTI